MDPIDAFVAFVTRALNLGKARRYAALAPTRKGQTKILDELCHEFEHAIRLELVQRSCSRTQWESPCYAYSSNLGFGQPFPSLREATDRLSIQDGWLIVVQDGSAGIHRPENRWDAQRIIIPGSTPA